MQSRGDDVGENAEQKRRETENTVRRHSSLLRLQKKGDFFRNIFGVERGYITLI